MCHYDLVARTCLQKIHDSELLQVLLSNFQGKNTLCTAKNCVLSMYLHIHSLLREKNHSYLDLIEVSYLFFIVFVFPRLGGVAICVC